MFAKLTIGLPIPGMGLAGILFALMGCITMAGGFVPRTSVNGLSRIEDVLSITCLVAGFLLIVAGLLLARSAELLQAQSEKRQAE